MGETARDTAREVELTRKQMEERLSELSDRAPQEARRLLKRVLFAVLTAAAVFAARKLINKLWERFTGEPPPGEEEHGVGRPPLYPRARPGDIRGGRGMLGAAAGD